VDGRGLDSANAPLEPDRWRELYPVPSSHSSLAQLSGRRDIEELVGRWLQFFEVHGVKHQHIPSLLPQHYLPLTALMDGRQIATLLEERVLRDASELFNVCYEWLIGDSDLIYHGVPLSFDVRGLLRVLEAWIPTCEEVAMFGFRGGKKPLEDAPPQTCAFMLRGTIPEFGEKPVFKYQPLYDAWRRFASGERPAVPDARHTPPRWRRSSRSLR
jgi:hypothetical protein